MDSPGNKERLKNQNNNKKAELFLIMGLQRILRIENIASIPNRWTKQR